MDTNVVVSEVVARKIQPGSRCSPAARVSNVAIDGKNSRTISTEDPDGAEVLTLRLTCEAARR